MATITIIPQRALPGTGDDVLVWDDAAETLTVNGTAFDLSSIPTDGCGEVSGAHPFAAPIERSGSDLAIRVFAHFDGRTAAAGEPSTASAVVTPGGGGALTIPVTRRTFEAGEEPATLPSRDLSGGHTLTTKTAAEIAADTLAVQRAGMRAYKRAFNLALAGISATGALATRYPSATTMLDAVNAFAADSDTAGLATALSIPEANVLALQQARADITEYIRTHADVAGMQAVFGLTDVEVDAIFTAAAAFEA